MNKRIRKEITEYGKRGAEASDEPASARYAVNSVYPWMAHSDVVEHFFMHDSKAPEREMEFFYFDIPHLHTYSTEGSKFILAMDQYSESKGITPYNNETITVLVNYHWTKHAQRFFNLFMFAPFIACLITLLIWNYWILSNQSNLQYEG
jgi:hypothetical protein